MAGVDDFNLDLEDLAADVNPVVKEGYLKKKKTKGAGCAEFTALLF